MATWKKVIVSGSGVSQLENDAGYVASVGGGIISSSAEGDNQGQIKFNGVNVDAHELGTNDSPQFASIEVGAATDTTLGRTSAGVLNVEGNDLLRASGDSVVSGSAQIAINSTTGTLSVDNGGTGATTLTSGQVLIGNGTSAVTTTAIGISDNNIVAIDSTTVADNEYARFTANGLESRTAGEVLSDITSGTGVVSGSSQIDGASITNNTVSFGGVSVALGGEEAQPAFDLINATNYPYGSLTGTPSGIVSASSLSSPNQGEVALTTNGVAQAAIDLGLQTTDSPTFSGLTISNDATNGNLSVLGDLVSVNVDNINVEDQFILINSGSDTGDSGIVFGGSNGASQVGHSIFWDQTDSAFSFGADVSWNSTGVTAESKIGNIQSSTSNPSAAPTFQGVGTIHIKTDTEDIWIYA
jgi:hypothetical protein